MLATAVGGKIALFSLQHLNQQQAEFAYKNRVHLDVKDEFSYCGDINES